MWGVTRRISFSLSVSGHLFESSQFKQHIWRHHGNSDGTRTIFEQKCNVKCLIKICLLQRLLWFSDKMLIQCFFSPKYKILPLHLLFISNMCNTNVCIFKHCGSQQLFFGRWCRAFYYIYKYYHLCQ